MKIANDKSLRMKEEQKREAAESDMELQRQYIAREEAKDLARKMAQEKLSRRITENMNSISDVIKAVCGTNTIWKFFDATNLDML